MANAIVTMASKEYVVSSGRKKPIFHVLCYFLIISRKNLDDRPIHPIIFRGFRSVLLQRKIATVTCFSPIILKKNFAIVRFQRIYHEFKVRGASPLRDHI